jgi:hypothetical protein
VNNENDERERLVCEELERLVAEGAAASEALKHAKTELELRLNNLLDIYDRIEQLKSRGYF